jgi:NitT/TauT family transport system substrate-binding protein
VVGNKLLSENPELVGKMVRASLQGLKYTLDNPEEAFSIVREVIPEMTDEDAPVQRQVLDTSIELWRSDNLGVSSQEDWQASIDVLRETGLLEKEVELEKLYTNQFIEGD